MNSPSVSFQEVFKKHNKKGRTILMENFFKRKIQPREIYEEYKIPRSTIFRYQKEYQKKSGTYKPKKYEKHTKEQKSEVLMLRKQKKTFKNISNATGIPEDTVGNWVRQNNRESRISPI
ncbi:MAG: hypothetical protein LBG13_02235 [Holosporales bacterium]|nr:hypothetical protein [Holosporales bacterium]